MYSDFTKKTRVSQDSRHWIFIALVAISLTLLLSVRVWYASASQPPQAFPLNADVTIEEGMTVREISKHLETSDVIASSFVFNSILSEKYPDQYVKAGTYRFTTPLDTQSVIDALVRGDYQTPLRKATFPEGFRIRDFNTYFSTANQVADEAIGSANEGYLFPDTYYIKSDTSRDELLDMMRKNYAKKLASLSSEIEASTLTETEIVILASILEREANDETSLRMVSGVLHNRLKADMPLQVDAAFEYILGKGSAELTDSDLQIDSPYNTYTHTGFPPTPISNPGMFALQAAIAPIEHDYLFYLTGSDGEFYYAKTFDEHRQNKARYLR